VKRAVSILLLALFLFNVGGYYIVFWGLRQHHNYQLNSRLDANQYSKEETVELKIPLSLPYPLTQSGYERINGRFEHNGEFYKLVKKQVVNDILYVVCIRDQKEKQIVETMKEVESLTSDVPTSDKDISLLAKLLKDFESHETPALAGTSGWVQGFEFSFRNYSINSADLSKTGPPPRANG
jgi:hypothetical protein